MTSCLREQSVSLTEMFLASDCNSFRIFLLSESQSFDNSSLLSFCTHINNKISSLLTLLLTAVSTTEARVALTTAIAASFLPTKHGRIVFAIATINFGKGLYRLDSLQLNTLQGNVYVAETSTGRPAT